MGPNMPLWNVFIRKCMYVNAFGFMSIPMWEVLLGTKWKEELCEGFCFAYEGALSGLLSDVYNGKLGI